MARLVLVSAVTAANPLVTIGKVEPGTCNVKPDGVLTQIVLPTESGTELFTTEPGSMDRQDVPSRVFAPEETSALLPSTRKWLVLKKEEKVEVEAAGLAE